MITKIANEIIKNSSVVEEAPNDGNSYVRSNKTWTLQTTNSGIVDAPTDGFAYNRKNGGWNKVDPTSSLVQHDLGDLTIGVNLVYPSGGSGTWSWINKDGNFVRVPSIYFSNHPIYSGINSMLIDGQHMIRIPKFFYKNIEHKSILISPTKLDSTYKCHPAFMKAGVEQDQFWIGKYVGSNGGSSKVASQPSVAPWVNINFTNFKTYCSNRNGNGVSGFCMPNIYMMSAIQILFLIEYCTTDAQSAIGLGHVNGSSADSTSGLNTSTANYRGIIGLWGNVWEWIDGIQCVSNKLQVWDNQGNETFQGTGVVSNLGNGWIKTVSTETGDNYDLKDIFIPTVISSEQTQGTYSDSLVGSAGDTKGLFGGSWVYALGAGLFSLDLYETASYTSEFVGCRLANI